MKKRIVLNLIGGPGTGKSLYASYIFALLKMKGLNAEYVQEYAKELVWSKKTELLKNQHHISYYQYKMIKGASKYVDIVVTDGSLIHSYYYNRHNKPNYSDITLTEDAIDTYVDKFENINIYLKRNNKYSYQTEGRYQTFDEALEIDCILLDIMEEKKLKYKVIEADMDNVDEMIEYILKRVKKIKKKEKKK